MGGAQDIGTGACRGMGTVFEIMHVERKSVQIGTQGHCRIYE